VTMALGLALMGADLRTARHGAFRTLSDLGALHGQFASFNFAGILGASLAPLHRHVSSQNLRSAVCRLLPLHIRPVLTFIGLLLIGKRKTTTWFVQKFDFQHASRRTVRVRVETDKAPKSYFSALFKCWCFSPTVS